MCRNIRPLNNFAPPATNDEVAAAALQFVRKVSGMTKPSQANQAAFDQRRAPRSPTSTRHLLDDLVTTAPPKNREVEAAKAAGPLRRPLRRMTLLAGTRPGTRGRPGASCGTDGWSS